MGVNISIQNQDGEVPEWDCGRYAGDRYVMGLLYQGEVINHPKNDMDVQLYRPADVEAFYVRLIENIDANHDRWRQMADLLKDPQNWLYFSV